MEFFSEIKRLFKCNNMSISERMNTVETLKPLNIAVMDLPEVQSLQSICNSIPIRDTLTLTIKNDSDELFIINNQLIKEFDFSEFIDGMSPDDFLEVRIQIDKSIEENKFSIYDFDSFIEDLLRKQLTDVLKWFSTILKNREYLIFEVYDYDISLSTGTMGFVSDNCSLFTPKINRQQKLGVCRETAYFYNMNIFEVIPDDFKIEGIERTENSLKSLFGRLATILSLTYVCSSASIHDLTLNLQINGQRTSIYSLALDEIQENMKWLSIYSWIYTDGNPTDKSIIVHNVLSLHCKYSALLDIDDKVFDSIKSNYKLYLRNNVGQYLDLKRDISKFILSIITQVGDYAVSILNKFKTNLIAIFGFLFTVVLTRVGATQKWEDIFTRHTYYLIEIVLIGSLGYLVICIFEVNYKLKKTKYAYKQLKDNYRDILDEAEIIEAFGNDKLLFDAEISVRKGMIVWSVIWGSMLVTTILIIEILTPSNGVFLWLWNKLL